MVKLTIYDSGNRPELPKDPSTAAHWVIEMLAQPNMKEAYEGGYEKGTEYKEEWTGAFWHIDCKPLDVYIRRALGKAVPHKTPRIDIDLPTEIDGVYAEKDRMLVNRALGRMLGTLGMIPHDLELNLIVSGERLLDDFLAQLEQMYQGMRELK